MTSVVGALNNIMCLFLLEIPRKHVPVRLRDTRLISFTSETRHTTEECDCYVFIHISVFSDMKSDECQILLFSYILKIHIFHAWIISDSTAQAKFPTFV